MLLTLVFCFSGVQVPVCNPDFPIWPVDQDIRPWVLCSNTSAFGSDCLDLVAGPDGTGFVGSPIFLDGAQITVPHSTESLSFGWVQIDNGAPTVVLDNSNSLTPSFLPAAAGTYEFELQGEWLCRAASDRVSIVVDNLAGPPTELDAVVVTSFSNETVVQVTYSHPGDDRLFLVRKSGRIMIYRDGAVLPTPFLDISSLVSTASEQGLLGLAFDPDYATNGSFYVNYTGRTPDGSGSTGDTRIVAYQRDAVNPDLADQSQRQLLLSITQPFSNHNGGMLTFGPDGYLYIGTGDGGSAGDPQNNAQNPLTLLGKMLRIEVNGLNPYTIPADNPFVGDPGTLDEIWALGVRNPWRFSFDRNTGDLFIADVGQNQWEEIDVQPAASTGGENYGWRLKEGDHCFNPSTNCDPGGLTDPVWEYQHTNGRCSITGGFVYRGPAIPVLNGFYLYGDYCSGEYWLLEEDSSVWNASPVGVFVNGSPLTFSDNITAFGQDALGELYILTERSGTATVHRLTGVHSP